MLDSSLNHGSSGQQAAKMPVKNVVCSILLLKLLCNTNITLHSRKKIFLIVQYKYIDIVVNLISNLF